MTTPCLDLSIASPLLSNFFCWGHDKTLHNNFMFILFHVYQDVCFQKGAKGLDSSLKKGSLGTFLGGVLKNLKGLSSKIELGHKFEAQFAERIFQNLFCLPKRIMKARPFCCETLEKLYWSNLLSEKALEKKK